MTLRRVGVLSIGKIACLLYGVIGILAGLVVAAITPFFGASSRDELGPLAPLFFGVGAIVFLPLMYAVIGFIVGVVASSVYNLAARTVGGVEFELDAEPRRPPL